MLQTSKSSEFNRISQQYRDELNKKKLEKGQTVSFRLLDKRLNPDPEDRRKQGREFIWKQSECILGKDRIRDPFTSEIIDIGVVQSFDKEGNATVDKLYIPAKDTNGFITIVGGNIEQEVWYEFLLICNENESNPHRDTNIKPKFKAIDSAKEDKAENSKFDVLTDMLNLVKDSSVIERKEMALAFAWDGNSGDESITKRLREIVVKDPVSFSKTVGNKKDLSTRAIINEAVAAGVITFAPLENKYTFAKTNETIASFTRSETVQPTEQLLEWLQTNTKGVAVLSNIKKQLKPAPELV